MLDAKYYRYGVTAKFIDLPNSSDINKQITYGAYIHTLKEIPNDKLFNAFLMPFNMFDNTFGIKEEFGNIGEVTGDWSSNNIKRNYEHIQGIVVDVRSLMYQHTGQSDHAQNELVKAIEFGLENPI